jgi:hypothetical protein
MSAAQSTDAENSKAPFTATNVGKAKTLSSKSAQAIARDTSNQNTVTGSGADCVEAKVSAGS